MVGRGRQGGHLPTACSALPGVLALLLRGALERYCRQLLPQVLQPRLSCFPRHQICRINIMNLMLQVLAVGIYSSRIDCRWMQGHAVQKLNHVWV